MRRKKLIVLVGLVVLALCAGCDVLRFAPGEVQKQNAYVHHRTVAAAAQQARQEETSPTLQALTSQATQQSEAIVAYYGLPQEIPPSETVEQLLQPVHQTLAETARAEAIQRPDPWEVADYLLELGIGFSGILGGAFGVKMARKLQLAREKSTALQEIVKGNESFKRDNPEYTGAFKQAQQNQSATTRTLVTALKE
ncbi:MAG: hypothetical protein JW810_03775 [Sedimentisphaerales bacterium]|nr:hypothetical protein [Sedimentisphaerales bacterium]